MSISVIVTNWNGCNLLKKYLKQVVLNSPEATEIIVADDASTDDSLAFTAELQKKYSKIRIISHKKNLGFGANSNCAVKSAKSEFVVLLNNDIDPQPNYISYSLKHFQDPSVFGVGFAEIGHENWARIFWSEGYLQHEPGLELKQTHISGWVSGGSSIIRRSYFLKLKGFDPVYAPFYSEDLDLGYRAWKSGYRLLWEPKSRVFHRHESTMSKFPKKLLDYVKERNRLLTVWRNITDPEMLTQNRWAQFGRLLFGPNYLKIILAARRQIKKSQAPVVFPQLSDRQIFNLFKL